MNSTKQFDCITVGDVFMDIVMSGFASLPQLGEEAFAGFIYGLLQDESPERCLRIANLCGALSTESLGGIASFPDRDRVLAQLYGPHNS